MYADDTNLTCASKDPDEFFFIPDASLRQPNNGLIKIT